MGTYTQIKEVGINTPISVVISKADLDGLNQVGVQTVSLQDWREDRRWDGGVDPC